MIDEERIEIILPRDLRVDDEQDAIRVFEEEFAFIGVPVADSGLRTILDSQEPPLEFVIQLLTSPFAQGVEGSLLATALTGASKQIVRAIGSAYHSIARRFPSRSVHISLRVGSGDESAPSYSLSSDRNELESKSLALGEISPAPKHLAAGVSGTTMHGCRPRSTLPLGSRNARVRESNDRSPMAMSVDIVVPRRSVAHRSRSGISAQS
jgi:hypothetical protein